MGKLIVTNMDAINPTHHNEHELYEYSQYEVTDSREKYEVTGPSEGNQTVVAF